MCHPRVIPGLCGSLQQAKDQKRGGCWVAVGFTFHMHWQGDAIACMTASTLSFMCNDDEYGGVGWSPTIACTHRACSSAYGKASSSCSNSSRDSATGCVGSSGSSSFGARDEPLRRAQRLCCWPDRMHEPPCAVQHCLLGASPLRLVNCSKQNTRQNSRSCAARLRRYARRLRLPHMPLPLPIGRLVARCRSLAPKVHRTAG
jgi:hypothetical protein